MRNWKPGQGKRLSHTCQGAQRYPHLCHKDLKESFCTQWVCPPHPLRQKKWWTTRLKLVWGGGDICPQGRGLLLSFCTIGEEVQSKLSLEGVIFILAEYVDCCPSCVELTTSSPLLSFVHWDSSRSYVQNASNSPNPWKCPKPHNTCDLISMQTVCTGMEGFFSWHERHCWHEG